MSLQFIDLGPDEEGNPVTGEMFVDDRTDWMRLVDHAGVVTPQGLEFLHQRYLNEHGD